MDYLDWMTYGGLFLMALGGLVWFWGKKAPGNKPQERPDDHIKSK